MSMNDITGDKLVTKSSTEAYRDGWDRIFGDRKRQAAIATPEEVRAADTLETREEPPGTSSLQL